MRAIAVSVVVLFHLWPWALTGGYTGVDIFFVISGFLITTHLLDEVNVTGTVALTNFWARRARRLLPAAMTVLVATFIAAQFFLPKAILRQAITEIGASAVYAQNWLLSSNAVDYLAADNVASVVQHYWSLSVEEQFYIIWPLLILVAIWMSGRRRSSRPQRTLKLTIVAVMGLVFLVSLLASIVRTSTEPASAYFVTDTRAWEFAAGGLLACMPAWLHRLVPARFVGAVRSGSGWVGLAAVVFAATTFDAATEFPGYMALFPVLGTVLLLGTGGEQAAWSPSRLLSLRPLQIIGDLSYGIYLWHWPLVVLFPYIFGTGLTVPTKLLVLALTVALAFAMKALIEDPVRGAIQGRRPVFLLAIASIALVLGGSGVSTLVIDHNQQRQTALAAQALANADACVGAAAMEEGSACLDPYAVTDSVDPIFAAGDAYWSTGLVTNETCPFPSNSNVRSCEFGEMQNPVHTVALVGDSHAEHLFDPLLTYAQSHRWRVVLFGLGGCNSLESQPSARGTIDQKETCRVWSDEVQAQLVSREDIDIVLFSNRSVGYKTQVGEVLEKWNAVLASGKSVIALKDVPGMPEGDSAPECVELHAESYDPCSQPRSLASDFMAEAVEAEAGAVPMLDLTSYFCDQATCHTVIGGVLVYFDDRHITVTFGRTLAPYLGQGIDEILAAQREAQ